MKIGYTSERHATVSQFCWFDFHICFTQKFAAASDKDFAVKSTIGEEFLPLMGLHGILNFALKKNDALALLSLPLLRNEYCLPLLQSCTIVTK